MENSVNLEFYKNPRSKESILLWFPLHFTSNSVASNKEPVQSCGSSVSGHYMPRMTI